MDVSADELLVAELDAAAAAAWPGIASQPAPGMLLRASSGFTHRGNSAAVLAPDVDLAIVERFATQHGIPPMLQIANHPRYEAVRCEARHRGYRPEPAEGLVMTAALPLGRTAAADGVEETGLHDAWIELWLGAARGTQWLRPAADLLARVPEPRAFLRRGDDAVGLGVVTGPWLGIFCMATAPSARRRGNGLAMVHALAAFGQAHGATAAYLQVEPDNEAARALYASVGFAARYGYWSWTLRA